MPLTGMVGALEGQEELSLRSDELSRLGKGPSGGERAVPGTLISMGGEGERCLAGSSLCGRHRGDCAWARGRGVWRQGGAWVCGEKGAASAGVSRREGSRPRPPDKQPGMACNGQEMKEYPRCTTSFPRHPLPPYAGKTGIPQILLLPPRELSKWGT